MISKEPHVVDVRVGANLKALRKQRGHTQKQLGELLGLTFQQIQKYEKGSNRLSASKLDEIAKFFNIGVESFFEGCGSKNRSITVLPYSQIALDVAAAIDQIDDHKMKKQIKQLVLTIANS